MNDDKQRLELKKQLQNEFSKLNGMHLTIEENQFKLVPIILNIYRRNSTFKRKYPSLNNIAYNTFIMVLKYQTILIKEVTTDSIISMLEKSLCTTEALMDSIENGAELIENDEQKMAYYNMMDKLHILTKLPAQLFMSMHLDACYAFYLYTPSISFEKISRNEAMGKLCELTRSGEYSNFERLLEIFTENAGNFVKYDKNGMKRSNLANLNLSDEDIYLLYLLTTQTTDDLYHLITAMDNSISVKSKKVTKKEVVNGFGSHRFERLIGLPLFKDAVCVSLSLAQKASKTASFIKSATLNAFSFLVNSALGSSYLYIKLAKNRAIASAYDKASSPTRFSCIFNIVPMAITSDQTVRSYNAILNTIIGIGLYTYQNCEIFTLYNQEVDYTINRICHLYDLNPDTFKSNVIEKHRDNIKNQLSAIFSTPVNISLDAVLDKSLNEMEALHNDMAFIASIDETADIVNRIDTITKDINPNMYMHTVSINIEELELEEISDTDSNDIFYDANLYIEDHIEKNNESSDDTFYSAPYTINEEIIPMNIQRKLPFLNPISIAIAMIILLLSISLFVLYHTEVILFMKDVASEIDDLSALDLIIKNSKIILKQTCIY
ncbi:hypothetical protein NEPAR06_0503 [Nematocida parisii]|uniref:Uncharacterized protein n=1 Tax=Nematocida parisii (strain ERTm3) TaxID=935791 RepID=I3EJF1_NEMP3|nr:uncharacterized protein NEPG_01121 [Nematocida parisii ERTm1]EIJ89348.1 hypothetical protein NEQG_00118 [Nematocida parisii ERTm3]KAI5142579.1 hypothetical protein NEPAR07_0184 [Nematocida parisii]EIJ94453.1 hypothetical protein NEPG_01121 [Nematocida parisii ERTm1]KAI5153503.1 hypothetical protein NEPAR06_0503 [Nematocida parisii]KAI5156926.1 hypothetical protein NEPAR05_0909 [Nematocida parisii]|eukprot:XP_013058949.1 hypothetical protein NEPG_01121 [Nematocida parisii ERTm1]